MTRQLITTGHLVSPAAPSANTAPSKTLEHPARLSQHAAETATTQAIPNAQARREMRHTVANLQTPATNQPPTEQGRAS